MGPELDAELMELAGLRYWNEDEARAVVEAWRRSGNSLPRSELPWAPETASHSGEGDLTPPASVVVGPVTTRRLSEGGHRIGLEERACSRLRGAPGRGCGDSSGLERSRRGVRIDSNPGSGRQKSASKGVEAWQNCRLAWRK
jgi:hypothetical protein